jgi:hypothetical protein
MHLVLYIAATSCRLRGVTTRSDCWQHVKACGTSSMCSLLHPNIHIVFISVARR